jgi:hypothetical protein
MTITGVFIEGFGNQGEVETAFRIRSPSLVRSGTQDSG